MTTVPSLRVVARVFALLAAVSAACGPSGSDTTRGDEARVSGGPVDVARGGPLDFARPFDAAQDRGGRLVATVRAEPRTFNRLVARDNVSALLSDLTQAPLVRINRETDQVEPWVAESWTVTRSPLPLPSPSRERGDSSERGELGDTYTLRLREGVTFSDGAPLTSADVLFSFAAVYDERVASPLADAMRVGGKPLHLEVPDASTIVIRFPASYSPGLRMIAGLPILPKHRLAGALKEGRLAEAWGLATPPSDIIGAGPFVIQEYVAGQRVMLGRNPRYWRQDASGEALPYLDGVVLEIVADQNAELLRLDSGDIDMMQAELRAEDIAGMRRAAREGRVQLFDLGPGLDADFLFFNLTGDRGPGAGGQGSVTGGQASVTRGRGSGAQAQAPGAARSTPGTSTEARGWLKRDEFRQAISRAVDRRAFVDTVYLGEGEPVFGPVTPGNRRWFAADTPRAEFDPARARVLLASIGLSDRDGDGMLEDQSGAATRFTLLTQKGNTVRERAAAVIQEDLRGLGIGVDVVALDFGALIERVTTMNFEAAYLGFRATDTDPAVNLDFWLSSAAFHVWNPAQKMPVTEWERRIDELMLQQMAAADDGERQRLFAEVQRIFAEHEPALYFGASRVIIAASTRLANVQPTLLQPQVLWRADELGVRRQAIGGRR